jgi:Double zinc ribbon
MNPEVKLDNPATTAELICPSCKNQIDPHSKFCIFCGARIIQNGVPQMEPANETPELTCPVCGIDFKSDLEFCPYCGYAFATKGKGVGPFLTKYPLVKDAYTPSGIGSWKANLLMLILGVVSAIICAWIYLVLESFLVREYAPMIRGVVRVVPFVFVCLVFLILGAILSLIVLVSIEFGERIGKSRKVRDRKIIGIIAGAIFFAFSYWIMPDILGVPVSAVETRILLKNYPIAAAWIWCGFMAFGLILVFLNENIKGSPFCEQCHQFMKKITLDKYHILNEDEIMGSVSSQKFDEIANLVSDVSKDEKNYTQITFWYCSKCKNNGFLDVCTSQTRYIFDNKGTRSTQVQNRLIFSSPIDGAGIKALINLA